MKVLVGIIIGIGLAIAGQAMAQYFEYNDNSGGHISGYTDPNNGLSTWQDNRGHSGSMYSAPAAPYPNLG